MLLGFVLSALLVAQAGHSGIVQAPDLGLALGASAEGAESLGGGQDGKAFALDLVTAGGADHLAVRLVSQIAPRAGEAPIAAVVVTASAEHVFGLSAGLDLAPAIPVREANVHGLFSLGHSSVLSRDIPPVPQSLNRGRGELSLVLVVVDVVERVVPLHEGAATNAELHAGIEGLDERGPVAFQGSHITRLLKVGAVGALLGDEGLRLNDGFDYPLASVGVDVFHERSIAQPLAHVKNYLCGIFAGVA